MSNGFPQRLFPEEVAMNTDLRSWPINDDAENELRFWLKELLASLGLGGVFGLATAVLIAFLPKGAAHPGGEFAWDFWPYLVEFAFWLGMFAGLLWGGSKRLGMALAAGLPWRAPVSEREETGRCFGQWSAFAALAGFFLWLAHQVALAARLPEVAAVMAAFSPVATACGLVAGLFAAVALAHRPRKQPRRLSGL